MDKIVCVGKNYLEHVQEMGGPAPERPVLFIKPPSVLRAAAMGWRNVLCETAYVVHLGGASFSPLGLAPNGENLARLLARWPDYNERVARFIMADPLRPLRERLSERIEALARSGPQRDLFG